MKEARIEVSGRVQGIHFRNNIKNLADREGLKGNVMNLVNGGLLIIVQGEREKINLMIDWLKQNPGLSKVEDVNISWSNIDKVSDGFKIVREGNFFSDKFKSIFRLVKRIFGFAGRNGKFESIPGHVAIIPDGNRRWAKFRGLESHFGHYKSGSYSNIESLLKEAKKIEIKYVSIWGFSTENWKRSEEEKRAIFDMLLGGVERFMKFAKENEMRFRHIGRKDRLPKNLINALEKLENETKDYRDFEVLLCLDYGGRDEILRAVNKMLKSRKKEASEKDFAEYLDTTNIPDPDLIIRTSGEQRISGFMPFQAVYAELYFSDVYFPEFGIEELHKAIGEYGKRKRRFGGG